jgi:hypothetical protein
MVHMSMATNRTPLRQAPVCASIQSETVFAVRPSTCPSSLAPPFRSTNPTCQRSVMTSQTSLPSAPVARRNLALPRRVSSMPRRSTGGVTAGSALTAYAANALFATGQEISWSREDWMTVRPRSATAAPADSRSRQVSLVRAGICGRASVKVLRGHSVVWQRQRRLFHVSSVHLPATGRSRGLVLTQECGSVERTPQSGQHLACSSVVTRASIGLSSSSSRTEVTATPSSPNRRVVSLVKPVAPCFDLLVSTSRRITELRTPGLAVPG